MTSSVIEKRQHGDDVCVHSMQWYITQNIRADVSIKAVLIGLVSIFI